MRYPDFLQDGGRIGFIAPSFGCATEPYISCFKEALKRFEAMGFETVIGPNCSEDKGVGKSNLPELCGAEINDFFTNDKCDVIISCGGGETMCEDLPYVDFEKIAESKPKWFMGYSDNTNLTFTLPTLCDIAAVYGPNASSFGQRPWHPAIEDALNLLRGRELNVHNYPKWEIESFKADDNPYVPFNTTEDFCMSFGGSAAGKNEVSFSGRMIGGCLDSLAGLCGTSFDRAREFSERYAADGIIWFLESCELRSMSIRRTLWQLENAGWFTNVRGFIIGRPYEYDMDDFGLDRIAAFRSALDHFNVPVLLDVDLGHLPPAMPIISGAMAEVTAKSGSLAIKQRMK